MKKETLYNFFEGKASPKEKEAIRIWLEASPDNEKELFREREFLLRKKLRGKVPVPSICWRC